MIALTAINNGPRRTIWVNPIEISMVDTREDRAEHITDVHLAGREYPVMVSETSAEIIAKIEKDIQR